MHKNSNRFILLLILSLAIAMVCAQAGTALATENGTDSTATTTDWSSLVPGTDYVDGQVIVTFSESLTSQDQMYAVAKAHGCEVMKVISFADWKAGGGKIALLSTPEGVSVPDAIAALEKDALVTCAEPNGIGGFDDPVNGIWQRLQGADRYCTMASISQTGWADNSCDTVVVARGDDFPDALAGSGLAGILDCPVLLTSPTVLSAQVSSEITRLGAQKVIILGSTSSVSSSVEDALKASVGSANVSRVYGSSRYETSKAVYDSQLGNWSSTLIVATGISSSDVLSISAYADASSSPIFLADETGSLSPSMKEVIGNGAFDKVILVGGPSSVSTETESWLESELGAANVLRLSGTDRYGTSSTIATWESGNLTTADFQPSTILGYDRMAIANGADGKFADGLAGGVICGQMGSVLVLSPDATYDNDVIDGILIPSKASIHSGYILGGTPTFSYRYECYLNTVFG